MTNRIVIFGATSAMAMEAAKIWATRGCDLCLIARSQEKLTPVAQDLKTRGSKSVISITSDLANTSSHETLFTQIASQFGDYDTILIAYGTLGDQKKCEQTFAEAQKDINTNFLSALSLLTPVANKFEKRGSGTIAVITSVAGDRGRKSNYIYGASKSALSRILQGMRQRFGATNIAVVDIRPGFTDTPMTAHVKKGPLFVSPAVVGAGIVKAIDKGTPIAYLPWFWRFIMLIITHIPEVIFKKTNI